MEKWIDLWIHTFCLKRYLPNNDSTFADIIDWLFTQGMEGRLNFETVEALEDVYSNKVFNQIAVSLNKFLS
jgi:hypothetical protein